MNKQDEDPYPRLGEPLPLVSGIRHLERIEDEDQNTRIFLKAVSVLTERYLHKNSAMLPEDEAHEQEDGE